MGSSTATASSLASIPSLHLVPDARLSGYTRFGLGGPAALLADAGSETALVAACQVLRGSGVRWDVIGGGSNLVVADAGFPGVVLRYTASDIRSEGNTVYADAGASLQALVDFSVENGLQGIHTMTGIPGWVGGAVYGNAGAYGRSMDQNVARVRYFDGQQIREATNEECRFRYRSSAFKDVKGSIVLSCELELKPGSAAELKKQADEILAVRNAKYPPTMKCAGSIFKNLIFAELPVAVQQQIEPSKVIHGKVPSAYVLELVGAKGMRNGDIHVAEYHANLLYNAGNGTARQVKEIIDELKARVQTRFGLAIEEEVQFVGF
jgi:UDP-N-acetylmuramate dehydrogenase